MKVIKILLLLTLSIVLALLSLHLVESSRDYYIYLDKFRDANKVENLMDAFEDKELLFAFLSHYISRFETVFFIFVITSLVIKTILFSKISDMYIYIIVYYLARFYLVHEVTQIRVDLAIGFFFLSFYLLIIEKRSLSILFFILSFFTHNSILFLLPIYLALIFMKDYSKLFKYAFFSLCTIFVLGIFGETFKFDLNAIMSYLPTERYMYYIDEKYKFEIPSLLTDVYFYIKFLSIVIIYKNRNNSYILQNKYIIPAAIVFIFTNFFFVALHSSFGIAARLSDLSSTMEAFVVATALYVLVYYNLSRFVTLKKVVYILLLFALSLKLFSSQMYLLEN